jgi:protein-disulfide isomerase
MVMVSPFRWHFALVLFVATSAALPSRAEEPLSAQRQAEIGEIVKNYVMTHPELIQDALNALDQKQKDAEAAAQKAAVAGLSNDLTKAENGVVLGNPKGDVTLVEFFDYNCGYCKKSLSDIMGLLKADPKLRIVLRDFPVLGPDSVEASEIALAVRPMISADQYMTYHQQLLSSRGRVGKDRAIQVATDLGVDGAKLQKALESGASRPLLSQTMHAADQLRIGGTPAFVIGDSVIVGAVGQESLASAIQSVRTCGKTAC